MDSIIDGELLVPLAELAATPRERTHIGGKAAFLAQLAAAGVPVPDALVLTTRVAELPEEHQERILRAVEERAQALGSVLAVRSSATIEDGVAAAAPGIFASRLHVAPAAVAAAVREVWASATTPLVRAYAQARGLERIGMAVIVQAQVLGDAAGVAYTRLPGQPEAPEMLIETHARAHTPAASMRIARTPGSRPVAGALPLDEHALDGLLRTLLQAEAAIAAPGGADIEWVAGREGVWIVQARPIVHPASAPAPAFPQALIEFSVAQPELVWHWDVSHNPDPLSPAQAGLVERMDRAAVARFRMRVVGGYLYVATPPDAAATRGELPARHEPAGEDTAGSLLRQFEDVWQPALEAALARAEATTADLDTVLAAYQQFYAVYAGELSERLGRARRALPAFLRDHGLGDPEALAGALLDDGSPARLETLIARVASGKASFEELALAAGPMSPAWDVAAPTFAETPELLHRAVAAARVRASRTEAPAVAAEARVREQLDPGATAIFERSLALARVARDLGELDDRLYARAQAAVRRALLDLARRWALPAADDIFFVPLDSVVHWAAGHGHGPEHDERRPDTTAFRRMAQAGRAARERQRDWTMPLAFAAGKVVELPGRASAALAASPGPSTIWSGRGTGGRARGTVVRLADLGELASLAAMPGPDPVLVVPAITPAMAVLLEHAVAVVAEHGGLLGHGAAMARELGLPCVVDCARAWHDLRTGDQVWIDGEAGLVTRTGGPA